MSDALDQNEPGLRRALEHLESILIPSETLEAWAVQRRIFALSQRRLLVAATSGRLICIARKLLGGFDVSDVRWQDLEDVKLSVGMMGADLIIRALKPGDLASESSSATRQLEFRGLRKEQAQAVYRMCQAQDQAWREKRRIRELEELRARAGAVHVVSNGGAPANSDAVRRLQEAKDLLDAKLISDAEYEAIKARIVSPH